MSKQRVPLVPWRIAGIGLLTCLSGCLFSGGGSATDDVGRDVGSADSGASDLASADVASPDSSGAVDASTPPDAAGSHDVSVVTPDLGDWQFPTLGQRRRVTWLRNGERVPEFVVPVQHPMPGTPVAAVADDGEVLRVEVDEGTAWVRVPEFGANGSFWLYFDGDGPPPAGPAWEGYYGVWHLTEGDRKYADSAVPDDVLVPLEELSPVTGVVGDGMAMPERRDARNALVAQVPVSELAGEATFEMWFEANDRTQIVPVINDSFWNSIFGERRTDANRQVVTVVFDDGGIALIVDTESRGRLTIGPGRHHLAVILRQNGVGRDFELFLDGMLKATITRDPDWMPVDQIVGFGSPWRGGGFIDELRFSKVARSPSYLRAVVESYPGDIFTYEPPQARP